ncbi:histone-lysine N-methyltransferase SETMAR [Trichonephila clavipes]|nr:histone-lysine N-methyltransferase SETMAR [Trichonephila clavipes]
MPLEALTGIGSCAGESKGSYKKRRPNDAYEDMMAFALQNSTIDEQQSVIRFLTAENDLIDKVDDIVKSDRRVTLRMLALKVDVSYGTMWTIVHDRVRFRKVCAAWVPKQLTDQQKELRMGLALQHLLRYQEDPAFMKRIVTGDET